MKATRLPMLRTVKGALRRLTTTSHTKEWYAGELSDLGERIPVSREQRLERLRGNRANYETIPSTVKLR